jgi:DNA-binding transcriptional MocR family regulator
MWKPKTINLDIPFYLAIADALEADVSRGMLKPGQKLPTHRDLADIIGVNVSTITRAYKEAERRGLIAGTIGRGTYITADAGTRNIFMKLENQHKKIIEMGLVLPLYSAEPDISTIMESILKSNRLNEYVQYSDPAGLLEHRQVGAKWVQRFGVSASPEEIIICAGAQHAITCCLMSLFKAGDRIAVDCLTYPGIKSIAKNLEIRLDAIAMDNEGMIPEQLEIAYRRDKIKGVYLMPTMQNPTTISMSANRRLEIAEIIKRNSLILVEDDIYHFTSFDNYSTLASIIPENTVYIAGLSKAFYAGLRVSFMVVPKKLKGRITKAVLDTVWMAPTLNAAMVSECIRSGLADTIISLKLKEISRRFELIKDMLCENTFSGGPSSFFLWLQLPNHWNSKDFENAMQKNGVNIFSGDRFAVGGIEAPSAVRISLSGAESLNEFRDGVERLANVLSNEYDEIDYIL